jgi:hypothetical protein
MTALVAVHPAEILMIRGSAKLGWGTGVHIFSEMLATSIAATGASTYLLAPAPMRGGRCSR